MGTPHRGYGAFTVSFAAVATQVLPGTTAQRGLATRGPRRGEAAALGQAPYGGRAGINHRGAALDSGTGDPASCAGQAQEAKGRWRAPREASSSGRVGPGPFRQQTQLRPLVFGRRGEKVSGCQLLKNPEERIPAFQAWNPIIQMCTPREQLKPGLKLELVNILEQR